MSLERASAGLSSDLRVTWRHLRRRPLWSLAIVAVLGLGLGANAAMFAGFEAWVTRPLDLRDPDRLVALHERQLSTGALYGLSPRNLVDFATPESGFESVAPFSRARFNFEGLDFPERVHGVRISHELFPMIGAAPTLGRNLDATDDLPGQPADVVLISERIWRERLGADPSVIGTEVRIDSRPHVVVGVMPEGFRFPEWAELWTPLGLDARQGERDDRWVDAIARLDDGVSRQAALQRVEAAATELAATYPETNAGWSVFLEPMRGMWVPAVIETALTVSLAAGLLMLLVVCANVASLLLAHATSRRWEFALRSALGGGRLQLARQLLVLCLTLSLLGGALGLLTSHFWTRWMLGLAPIEPPYLFQMRVDLRAGLFTLALSIVAGVICALAPIGRASGARLAHVLRTGGRGGDPSGGRLRSMMIVAEVALTALLLVTSLLMVRSFVRQQAEPQGYRIAGIVTAELALTDQGLESPSQRIGFVERLLEGVRTIEGVSRAAVVSRLPTSSSHVASVEAEGRPLALGEEVNATVHATTVGYLEQLDIPLLEGRDFTAGEALDGEPLAIVSAALARRLWGEEPALERLMRYEGVGGTATLTVVGVAGDVATPRDLVQDDRPPFQIYRPYGALPTQQVSLVLESSAPLGTLAPQIRDQVRRAGATAPVSELLPMETVVLRSRWVTRFFSVQLVTYAIVGLLIAAAGLYGLISDAALQRRHEMAIRLAMGASPSTVRRQVLARGIGLAGLGIVIGLPLGLGAAHLAASLLLDTSPRDPTIYLGVAMLLVAVGFGASWRPAQRAADADPIESLRAE